MAESNSVVTVTHGPLSSCSFGVKGTEDPTIFSLPAGHEDLDVLVGERLISDFSSTASCLLKMSPKAASVFVPLPPISSSVEPLSLENIRDVQTHPLHYSSNMLMTVAETEKELRSWLVKRKTQGKGKRQTVLLTDVTPPGDGRDARALKDLSLSLSDVADIHIVCGTLPKFHRSLGGSSEAFLGTDIKSDLNAYKEIISASATELLTEIRVGVTHAPNGTNSRDAVSIEDEDLIDSVHLRAGLIGEVRLLHTPAGSRQLAIPDAVLLAACASASSQIEGGIPIVLQWHWWHGDCIWDRVKTIVAMYGGKQVFSKLAVFDPLPNLGVNDDCSADPEFDFSTKLMLDVLQSDCYLGFTSHSQCDGYSGRLFSLPRLLFVLSSKYGAGVARMLEQQLLLSGGVAMRSHLTKNGGSGFVGATDVLNRIHYMRETRPAGWGATISRDGLVNNVIRFLSFRWAPPPPAEMSTRSLQCSVCKTMFDPDDGPFFEKFSFRYCTVKCLADHRKRGFKEA